MLEFFNYISFYYFIAEETSHCIVTFTGTCRIGSYSFPDMIATHSNKILRLNAINCDITIYNRDNRL